MNSLTTAELSQKQSPGLSQRCRSLPAAFGRCSFAWSWEAAQHLASQVSIGTHAALPAHDPPSRASAKCGCLVSSG